MNHILAAQETEQLLETLKSRFTKNMDRHKGINWSKVEAKLQVNPDKLWSLYEMERTGGEPDVVDFDKNTGEYVFFDCCKQTPKGRVSLCYDNQALESRKTFKPEGSAKGIAQEMGIKLMNEQEYRYLQSLGNFDLTTSSWIETPENIRKLGGGLFAHYRYGQVFIYHNGVESYYAVRGFRGVLKV